MQAQTTLGHRSKNNGASTKIYLLKELVGWRPGGAMIAAYLAYTLREYLQLACATARRLFSRLNCDHRWLKTRKQQ